MQGEAFENVSMKHKFVDSERHNSAALKGQPL